MSLEEGEVETLEFIKEAMDIESKRAILTEWEVNFIKDQLDRYGKYGTETHFSVKQWAIIEKVEETFQTGQSVRGRR